MNEIEGIKDLLHDGANNLGASAEHAGRNGDKMGELAGHLGAIAAAVQTALDRIPAAIECARAASGSGGLAAKDLDDALAIFRRVGAAQGAPREMVDVLTRRELPTLRSAARNADVIEQGLRTYLHPLTEIKLTVATNQDICEGQSENVKAFATATLPASKTIAEGWADTIG